MEQKFRFAVNGFNRTDVVNYLEYQNKKYTTQLSQLTQENLRLRREAENADTEELDNLRRELDSLRGERDALSQELAETKAQLSTLEAHCSELESRSGVGMQDELEAYRRAERVEREAGVRVEALRKSLMQNLSGAGDALDEVSSELDSCVQSLGDRLSILCACVSDARKALADAQTGLENE